MPHVTEPARFHHRPALDALRGLAVLVVVAFHSELGFAKGGYLGVSTFFTLSGFLIATLVLVEHAGSGRVDLRVFWRRRFRRLLPAAVVTIALVVALVAVLGDSAAMHAIGGDAPSSLFYVANWHLVLSRTSYAQLFASPGPLLHMWSLAVEEQFYLVFPLIVALLVGRRRRRNSERQRLSLRARLGILAVLTIGMSAIEPLVLGFGTDRTYYGTDTRAAEIAVGILLAVLAFPTAVGADTGRSLGQVGRRVLAVVSTLALVTMAAAWVSIPETSALWRHGGFVLYAVGSATVVAAGLYTVGPVGRIGSLKPLCRLGIISYAVYLVHWPVLWFISVETHWPPLVRFVVAMTVSVVVAELSLRFLETPIRRTGKVAGVSALAAVPLFAVVAVLGSVVVTHAAPPPVIDYAAAADLVNSDATPPPAQPTPTIGSASVAKAAPRVAFFGDSTALMTAAGFKQAAAGDSRVEAVQGKTTLGCGILLADKLKDTQGSVGPQADKCTQWPETWSAVVSANQPDLAVVQSGPWEAYDMQFAGVSGWHHLGDDVADAQARQRLQQVVDILAGHGAHVVFLTTSHVDRRLPGHGPCTCPERLDHWNDLLRETAAANPGRATVVDLDAWLQTQGTSEDTRLRADGVHFTEATATEVAQRWLIDQLLAVPRTPGGVNPAAATS
jgi:peptidoglycan/LPS O-acetylase OafA/YrhL